METIKVNAQSKHAGMTMIEVMITLIIAAILMVVTVPSLIAMNLDSRLGAVQNNLISDLALARNTSITKGNDVILCASHKGQRQCRKNAKNWIYGWIVFEDLNNDEIVSAGESVLSKSNPLDTGLSLASLRGSVKFTSEGTAIGYANTFTICDDRGDSAKKGLQLSSAGSSQSLNKSDNLGGCL